MDSFEKLKKHLCIVFAQEHYNPLGVVRTLGEYGISPVVIGVHRKVDVAMHSKYVQKAWPVDTVEEGYKVLMSEYGDVYYKTGVKPFVFTCDDKTEGYLDEHYDEMIGKFFFMNAGEQGRVTKYMDKGEQLRIAEKHGLNVLKSFVVNLGEIPEGIEYPIITKSISSNVGGWKSDVHICYSEEELKEAYKTIEAPQVLIQKYLDKKNEYCIDGMCGPDGKETFLAAGCDYPYLIKGYFSPVQRFENVKDKEFIEKVSAVFREIGYTGIFTIEFLIDKDDKLWFMEINFRNSAWAYSTNVAGMPLPILWPRSIIEGRIPDNIYREVPDGFISMVEPIDYAKRVETGMIRVQDWVEAFMKANCHYYYNEADPEPWNICKDNWKKLG